MRVDLIVFAALALVLSVNAYTLRPQHLDAALNITQLPGQINGPHNSTNSAQAACYAQYAEETTQIGVVGGAKIRFCDQNSDPKSCVQDELAQITAELNLASDKLTICLTEAAVSGIVPQQQESGSVKIQTLSLTIANVSSDSKGPCYAQYAQETYQIGVVSAAEIRFCDQSADVSNCIQEKLAQATAQMNLASDKLMSCLTEAALSGKNTNAVKNPKLTLLSGIFKLSQTPKHNNSANATSGGNGACYAQYAQEAYQITVVGGAKIRFCIENVLQDMHSDSTSQCVEKELFQISAQLNLASDNLTICLTSAAMSGILSEEPETKTSEKLKHTLRHGILNINHMPGYINNNGNSTSGSKAACWVKYAQETYQIGVVGGAKIRFCLQNVEADLIDTPEVVDCIQHELNIISAQMNIASTKLALCLTFVNNPDPWRPTLRPNTTTPAWNETTPSWPQWNTTIPPCNTTWPEFTTTTPSWNTTWPQWNTSTPTWNTTWPQWNTTTPSWNTTWPQWNTTTPSWNTTWPQWNTTTPSWNTTWPQWNTTAPSWNTTRPQWNTTTISWNTTRPNWTRTTPSRNTTRTHWTTITPSRNTTTPQWNTTTPVWNTTWPQWNTTTPVWNTTWPQWNTSSPSWNTTWPQFNTTSAPTWNTTTAETTTTTDSWLGNIWNHIKDIL